jgi:hypothetical protein
LIFQKKEKPIKIVGFLKNKPSALIVYIIIIYYYSIVAIDVIFSSNVVDCLCMLLPGGSRIEKKALHCDYHHHSKHNGYTPISGGSVQSRVRLCGLQQQQTVVQS